MDKRFADWYTLVSPVPPPDLLPHRWGAVESLVKGTQRVEDSVLLMDFIVSEDPSAAAVTAVEERLKNGDDSLPLKHRYEAKVLSAVAALIGIERGERIPWTFTAIAALTSSMGGLRPPIDDLLTVARDRDEQSAIAVRTRLEQPALQLQTERTYDDFENVSNVATAFTSLTGLLTSIDRDIRMLAAALRSTSTDMVQLQNVMLEQSDMTWLLVSKAGSRETFKTIDDAVRLAATCASSIRLFPSPPNLEGLIRAILRSRADDACPQLSSIATTKNPLPALPQMSGIEAVLPLSSALHGKTTPTAMPTMTMLDFVTALCREIVFSRYIASPA
jgi:hypothetical protein